MMRLAQRTTVVTPSAVREILKVAEQPEVRSFAGGLPAPELFPVEAIAEAHARVLRSSGAAALQYSTTEGFGPLREWIASRYAAQGAKTGADDVLVTNGSQQGIDLVARVLLDPGAVVVTENPTYLAALQVFQAAQATVVAVDSDREGMRLEALAKVLATHDARLIYLVPNFANPTGVTWSAARRAGLLALAQAWKVPVLNSAVRATRTVGGFSAHGGSTGIACSGPNGAGGASPRASRSRWRARASSSFA
jgi:2-aminoadipate transaminase